MQLYDPKRIAPVTHLGQHLLRRVLRQHIEPSPSRGLLARLRGLWKWCLPCPCCDGSRAEYFDLGGTIGQQIIPCSMCGGDGSYRAYERIRRADIEAINRPFRCGCHECSGEWER